MGNKRLLYLTNQTMTAWEWRGNRLCYPAHSFTSGEAGQQQFAKWLREQPKWPIFFLTDLIEETFQRDHVPHVRGEAHRNLLARRLNQLFRETPYRHAYWQEREKEGRRDDQVLFCALINAELLHPWINTIKAQHAPLFGIYSIAMLGPLLFRKLQLDIEHLLLVTRQSNGLRQSYFLHGKLRFSRLVPLFDDSTQEIAQKMVLEINKTRQFLASTRLLARDEKINIGILAGEDILQEIEAANEELALQHHQYYDLAQACHMLGVAVDGPQQYSDHLFLSVLAKHAPENQYGTSDYRRHYQLLQTRFACQALAGVFAVSGLLWTIGNLWQTWQAYRGTQELQQQTSTAQYQYEQVMKSLPATVGNPHDMKSAVDIEQMIVQNSAQPLPLFRNVSQVLEASPLIRINQMQWLVSDTEAVSLGSAAPQIQQAIANAPPPPPSLIGLPKPPLQILLIEGEVLPFQYDYRLALETVTEFSQRLGKLPQTKVQVLEWPLDIQPTSSIKGRVGNEDANARAKFILRVVFAPGGAR